jgi:methylenetetrahydrofolate reductase (NADPH)
MKKLNSDLEKKALANSVREAYMEIFPTDSIESKLEVLEPGAFVAVTCSPSKGVDETLDMSERIAARGFRVVPHVAAKMVKDEAHLREIMARLDDMPIVSLFVPGGDATKPAGKYLKALDLLRDIAEYDHRFKDIGVAGHPEGHPAVTDDVLLSELLKKQEVSNYVVTQMCFDADIIGKWVHSIRDAGVKVPVWIGLPSVSNRTSLMTTSLRIGVGNSLRYLKNHGNIAMQLLKTKDYRPDDLLVDLAPFISDSELRIQGHHIYCFNQVAKAEQWRHDFLTALE